MLAPQRGASTQRVGSTRNTRATACRPSVLTRVPATTASRVDYSPEEESAGIVQWHHQCGRYTAQHFAEEKSMQYRRLGTSGLQLSALSFGAWVTFGPHLMPTRSHRSLRQKPHDRNGTAG